MSNPGSAVPRIALNGLGGVTPINGARIYMLDLARALREICGSDLLLFTAKGESAFLPRELQDLAHELTIPGGRSYRQILQMGRIARALKAARVSVWHLPNTMPFLWCPTPSVITIHDVLDLKIRKYGILRTAYRWMVNAVAAHIADVVITDSHNSKRDLVEYLRVKPEKVVVIYPGVSESFCTAGTAETREATRKQLGTDQFFLFPGGISKNKNMDTTLHAFAHFKRAGGVHSLVITGEGSRSDMNSLRRLIYELEIEPHLILTGCLSRDSMPALYRAASAVLYPSLYEGFGFPVLEGMACGCPVITSNTSSLPEVAGDAAILVDPRDPLAIAAAMQRVTSSSALREQLITRGLARARSFSWARTASQTLDVYRAVLRQSPAQASLQETLASPR